MGKRVAGVCYIKYDGKQLAARGNWTVSISPFERQGIAGQDAVHGFSENPRIPFFEGDVTLTSDLSIEELDAVTGATITAELANGRVYTLFEAWTKSAFELNTHEGMTRVRFEGIRGVEQ